MRSLASSRRIREVRSARQRAATSTMVVSALDRSETGDVPGGASDQNDARVAIVAGRAVGNAVRRNRAKRRLRAATRLARLPVVDVVVDARRPAVDAPFDTLAGELERLTAKALERSRL